MSSPVAAQPGPADVVLSGGPVLTMDARRPRAEAVAVTGGRVAAVGSAAELSGLVGPRTEVVDLEGRALLPGLGLLDVTTVPQATRAIGELVCDPLLDGLTERLTGFENHMGATVLGPDARPLGRTVSGVGNGRPAPETGVRGSAGPAADGVVQGSILATYMHGPALSRNPQLADLLLSRARGVDSLPPVEVPAQERLRSERLAAAR